jgi:uncharacterized protein (TIGR02231 family)
MTNLIRSTLGIAFLCSAPLDASALQAAAQAPDGLPVQQASERGTITAVTLYPDRAAVTRTLRMDLKQGLWTLRIADLPRSVLPSSLQAKVSPAAGGAPKLLGVEFESAVRVDFASSPEGAALAEKVRGLQRDLERLGQERALLERHGKLVDEIGVRPTAAEGTGAVEPIDVAAVERQLAAVRAEKERILAATRRMDERKESLGRELAVAERQLASRGGADRTERAALVMLAVPQACSAEVSLTYLVRDASWGPSYAVRSSADRSSVAVEYDAMVLQRTGEDWKDVRLSLSTAEPTRASSPPPVEPWFVDVFVPAPPIAGRAGGFTAEVAPSAAPMAVADAAPGAPAEKADVNEMAKSLEALAAGAAVNEGGVAVTFELPRPVTLPSEATRRQRTRIGRFEPTTKFAYVAAPVVSESVFLRGTLTNTSPFQLLPGTAQVFMGGEFIGETELPPVAPNSEFRAYFGPDRAVRARREVVSRMTGSSGLFGGSTVTTWNDRITIDNGTGRAIDVEVYDRRPASRNERIESRLASTAPALSADKAYVDTRMPQGILRWDLKVPATARDANAAKVEWTVELVRPNGLQTTPLPD